MLNKQKQLEVLQSGGAFSKKTALKRLLFAEKIGVEQIPTVKQIAPMHFATNKYYSLYTPTMCAYHAHRSGCFAVGVNDYASLQYGKEFINACKILKIPYVCGYHVECEPLFNEQRAMLYAYGISDYYLPFIDKELQGERERKKKDVQAVITALNVKLNDYGIFISDDILTDKNYSAINEKHVGKILSEKLIEKFGKGEELLKFLEEVLLVKDCQCELPFLKEKENAYFEEDLAKVLYTRCALIRRRISPSKVEKFVNINSAYGAISSYKLSVDTIKSLGVNKIANVLKSKNINAVTIKSETLKENEDLVSEFLSEGILVVDLYRAGLPRQILPFNDRSELAFKSALALIGNAVSTSHHVKDGLFGENTLEKCPSFQLRLELFANVGRRGR